MRESRNERTQFVRQAAIQIMAALAGARPNSPMEAIAGEARECAECLADEFEREDGDNE